MTIETIKDLKDIANQGDADYQHLLGEMYYNGIYGLDYNKEEAFKWYEKAAVQGHPMAQCELAELYRMTNWNPKEQKIAANWLKKSAEQGNAKAQNDLGVLYAKGEGVNKDLTKSYKWYDKAAAQGFDIAIHNIAKKFLGGDGIKRNAQKCYRLFRLASNNGNSFSRFIIRANYDKCNAIKKMYNYDSILKDADKGDSVAQFDLYVMYDYGIGVDENRDEGYYWLRTAAADYHPTAQLELADRYIRRKEYQKAYDLYYNLSDRGFRSAILAIAKMYMDGNYFSINYDKAVEFFKFYQKKNTSYGSSLWTLMFSNYSCYYYP